MPKVLQQIPVSDPLAIPAQRAIVDHILADNQDVPGAMMIILNELQSRIGHISLPMQAYVAQKLHVPEQQIYGVVSFYSFFTTQPRGKHTLKFCMGTACYVGGTPQLLEKAKQLLRVEPGETTEDGLITVEVCRCVGACSQAPVIMADENVYGRVRPNKLPQIVRKYQTNGKGEGET
jgi:NADH:ubiquinone oxidoreductase subunit E